MGVGLMKPIFRIALTIDGFRPSTSKSWSVVSTGCCGIPVIIRETPCDTRLSLYPERSEGSPVVQPRSCMGSARGERIVVPPKILRRFAPQDKFASSVKHLAIDGGVDCSYENGDAEFHSACQAVGIDKSEAVGGDEAFLIAGHAGAPQ